MTPQKMATEAASALKAGTRLTLVRQRGVKPPSGFPRGELLCQNHEGSNAYSYDPARVLAWLNANRLIAIETLTPNVPVEGRALARPSRTQS